MTRTLIAVLPAGSYDGSIMTLTVPAAVSSACGAGSTLELEAAELGGFALYRREREPIGPPRLPWSRWRRLLWWLGWRWRPEEPQRGRL